MLVTKTGMELLGLVALQLVLLEVYLFRAQRVVLELVNQVADLKLVVMAPLLPVVLELEELLYKPITIRQTV